MSFSIILENASFFKKLISALEILEEPIFRIEADKMYVRQMDLTHSSMVHFELLKDVFTGYNCEKPDMIKVKRDDILNCLRKSKEEQYIGFSVQEGRTDNLIITLSEKSIKDFSIPIFEVLEEEREPPPPVSKATYNARIKIDAASLADTIEELTKVAIKSVGRAEFKVRKEHLIITAESVGSKGLTVTHSLGSDIIAMEFSEEVESSYSVESLAKITQNSAQLSGIVLIEFSSNMPIRLTYELPFSGILQFYLAPMMKIEE